MKRLLTVVFALALCAGLSFAQAGGGTTGSTTDNGSSTTEHKSHKSGKKGHKGGKKSKKGSSTDTTTPPPK